MVENTTTAALEPPQGSGRERVALLSLEKLSL